MSKVHMKLVPMHISFSFIRTSDIPTHSFILGLTVNKILWLMREWSQLQVSICVTETTGESDVFRGTNFLGPLTEQ